MIRWLLGAVGFVAISVGLNMVGSELFGYGTRAGLWFVRVAVRLLPPGERERWRKEWKADVEKVANGPDPNTTGGNHHLTAMAWGFWTLPVAVTRSRLLPRWAHNPKADQHMAGLVFGLGFGLVSGLVYGLFLGSVVGQVLGLSLGLVSGLVLGLVLGLVFVPLGLDAALYIGQVGGLLLALVVELAAELVLGPVYGLFLAPAYGLAVALGPRLSLRCGRSVMCRLRRRW